MYLRVCVFLSIVLFLTSILVSAQTAAITCPSESTTGEIFTCEVDLNAFDSTNCYDIKIYITDLEKKGIAKIENGDSWQTTYNFVKNAMRGGETKKFSLKVETYSGEATYDAKWRICNTTTATNFGTGNLLLKEPTTTAPEEKIPPSEEPSVKVTPSSKTSPTKESAIDQPTEEQTMTSQNSLEPSTNTPLILTNSATKDIKTTPTEEFISSTTLAWIGLFWFSILIAFLLMLQKRKYTNEFE